MNKTHKTKGHTFTTSQERQIKQLVVKPLADLIKKQTLALLENDRRTFKKVRNIKSMIEMIAREMARQLEEEKKE